MTDDKVHVTANAYNKVSDTYDRGRPDYTVESVAALIQALKVGQNSKVLEIGAGTGKFTKLLISHCPHVFAVEPVESMRKKFTETVPTKSVFPGNAENIPFEDSKFDAVFVANAFHWFNFAPALVEIQRVLKNGGGLGMIWLNDGVFASDWGLKLVDMLSPFEDNAPKRNIIGIKQAIVESQFFTSVQEMRFSHNRHTTPSLIVDRIASLSFIADLPESENKDFLARVSELIANHESTRNKTVLNVDCTTDIYWCFKK